MIITFCLLAIPMGLALSDESPVSSEMKMKVYDLGTLDSYAEQVEQQIVQDIGPNQWKRLGGPFTIRRTTSGQLVVTAKELVHDQISTMLKIRFLKRRKHELMQQLHRGRGNVEEVQPTVSQQLPTGKINGGAIVSKIIDLVGTGANFWNIDANAKPGKSEGAVPIPDPASGDNAQLLCNDPPSVDEVLRCLPNDDGGILFLQDVSHENVRIVIEQIEDKLNESRFYPLVGRACLHQSRYKCTVSCDETIQSYWPIPFTHTDQIKEVVYMDRDRLIRCAGPDSE